MGSVVIYRGPDCKIQIYYSSREGEVNAMIGPLDAPNKHGTYDDSGEWRYFTDFEIQPTLSLEELVKKLRAERANFETTSNWLDGLPRSASFVTSTRRVLWWSGGSSARLSVRLGSSSGDQSAAGEPWCSAHACRPSDARRSEYSCRRPRLVSLHLYEPGQPLFDRMGALDNILYWYTDGVVAGQAAKFVGDRAESFRCEFQVLSRFSILWTKRRVREHAAIFRVDPISD